MLNVAEITFPLSARSGACSRISLIDPLLPPTELLRLMRLSKSLPDLAPAAASAGEWATRFSITAGDVMILPISAAKELVLSSRPVASLLEPEVYVF